MWDFREAAGNERVSLKGNYALAETNGQIERNSEGPLSGYSAQFGQGPYLSLSNQKTKALNIHGQNQGVTVVAWVKWTGEQTGFVGGMWNEYQDGIGNDSIRDEKVHMFKPWLRYCAIP
ncbi:MAG: hypothetical protein ACK5GP_03690 [bacterium]